jgi:hypothetical protein
VEPGVLQGSQNVITEIEIEGFKSFEKVRLKLGGLNLFIGANGTGKSNFFDALRVLQGLGYGFTVDEVLSGKPKGAGSEVWEGIRGGRARAAFIRRDVTSESAEPVVRFSLQIQIEDGPPFSYSISIAPAEAMVRSESLYVRYSSGIQTPIEIIPPGVGRTTSALEDKIPKLSAGPVADAFLDCLYTLTNVQHFEP